ncbi:MAG: hypothetical protein V4678_01370 [Patescibacteria group bacterium]
MTERQGDYDYRTTDRHLSLVQPEESEVEYDESFVGPSGFDVRIIFQGKDVVKNRKRLLGEIARRATED